MKSLRRPSPLGGRKPHQSDLAYFATDDPLALDDVLPGPHCVGAELTLLIVGINPGLWTAAVNAPFARPGNRFWPSLARAGLTDYEIDASCGLGAEDEEHILSRGIGITNLVGRPTARADELSRDELHPRAVAIAGITAYRTAFRQPHAKLGQQDADTIDNWPRGISLWVVPQPSGLNAHENIDSLADKWRQVWADATRPE